MRRFAAQKADDDEFGMCETEFSAMEIVVLFAAGRIT